MFPPVILFSILFGLSTDYEVFLLSRVKEIYERDKHKLDLQYEQRHGKDFPHDAEYNRRLDEINEHSVAEGLERTAGIITAAGLIMIVVFGAFAMGHVLVVKELGRRPGDGRAARLDDHPRGPGAGLDEADGPPELVDAEGARLDPAHHARAATKKTRCQWPLTGLGVRRGSAVGAARSCPSGRRFCGRCGRVLAAPRPAPVPAYAHAGMGVHDGGMTSALPIGPQEYRARSWRPVCDDAARTGRPAPNPDRVAPRADRAAGLAQLA